MGKAVEEILSVDVVAFLDIGVSLHTILSAGHLFIIHQP